MESNYQKKYLKYKNKYLQLKNPVVNIAVEQPVFDDFRRLCALSKDTKIFNKCSDIYADNKP